MGNTQSNATWILFGGGMVMLLAALSVPGMESRMPLGAAGALFALVGLVLSFDEDW
jgi:hypothetical protein